MRRLEVWSEQNAERAEAEADRLKARFANASRKLDRRSAWRRFPWVWAATLITTSIVIGIIAAKYEMPERRGIVAAGNFSTAPANCDQARAMGIAPMWFWQTGYSIRLDADLDGVACEPYRGTR